MNSYIKQHAFYWGARLHARMLYLGVIRQAVGTDASTIAVGGVDAFFTAATSAARLTVIPARLLHDHLKEQQGNGSDTRASDRSSHNAVEGIAYRPALGCLVPCLTPGEHPTNVLWNRSLRRV